MRVSLLLKALFFSVVTLVVFFSVMPRSADAALINANGLLGQASYSDSGANYSNANTPTKPVGFFNPTSVALDTINHRLFVTDTGNNRVLVFDLNSDNTLGTTTPSYVLGQSNFTSNATGTTQASLNNPRGLAYDSTNDLLYVTDRDNSRIMIFDVNPATITNGENSINVLGEPNFTTSAGGLTQSTIGYQGPRTGIILDASNNRLFVVDGTNNRVLVYDVSSSTSPNALNGENASYVLGQTDFTSNVATTTQSGMNNPTGLGYDPVSMRLFVGEWKNHRVMVFDVNPATISNGENALNVLGQSDFTSNVVSSASPSSINEPDNMVYDTATNRIFIPDEMDNHILVFDGATSTITNNENALNVLGQSSFVSQNTEASPGTLNFVHAVDLNPLNNQLFVADYSNNRVMVFNVGSATISNGENAIAELGQYDSNGVASYYQSGINNSASPNALGFDSPTYSVIDSVNHRLFVSDSNNNRVLIFNLNINNTIASTTAAYVLGQDSPNNASQSQVTQNGLHNPQGLAYDAQDNILFVADDNSSRVLAFNVDPVTISDGENALNVLGHTDFTSGWSDTTQNTLTNPIGLAYDSNDKLLFVADEGNNRVMVFNVASSSVANALNGENALNVLGQSNFTTAGGATSQSGLRQPRDLAFDAKDSVLFVADQANGRVLGFPVVNASTTNAISGENATNVLGESNFISKLGSCNQSGVSSPYGLTYDSGHNLLFISDNSCERITSYDVSNAATADALNGENATGVIGQSNFSSSAVGVSKNAFNTQEGISYNTYGNTLILEDTSNNRLLQFPLIHITTTSLPYGAVGTAYAQTVGIENQQGTSQSFSVASGSLPIGLTLNSTTGAISGTPTTVEASTFTIKAADTFSDGSVFSDEATYTVNVYNNPAVPTLSTSAASSISSTGATLNGFMTNDGNASSTIRGFVWGTTSAYGATTTESGTFGIGSFSTSISSLTPGTTYHFAPYATNPVGTAYGPDQTFAALAVLSSLAAQTATNILTTGATLGGTVTNAGGAPVTIEGFNYGTTNAYGSVASSTGSFGTGSFSAALSGLSCGTTYHYQAFSVNSIGTTTTADQTFTTSDCPTVISTTGGGFIVGSGPLAPGYQVTPQEAQPTATTTASTTTPTGTSHSTLSTTQVQSILGLLTAFGADQSVITKVTAALEGVPLTTQTSSTTPAYVFTRDLHLGSRGSDVKALQEYLNTHGFQLANYGPGSPGHETDFFGDATRYQLSRFQKAHGITPAVGYFGVETRGYVENR